MFSFDYTQYQSRTSPRLSSLNHRSLPSASLLLSRPLKYTLIYGLNQSWHWLQVPAIKTDFKTDLNPDYPFSVTQIEPDIQVCAIFHERLCTCQILFNVSHNCDSTTCRSTMTPTEHEHLSVLVGWNAENITSDLASWVFYGR